MYVKSDEPLFVTECVETKILVGAAGCRRLGSFRRDELCFESDAIEITGVRTYVGFSFQRLFKSQPAHNESKQASPLLHCRGTGSRISSPEEE
jgi:hypothetical protein